MPAWDVFVKKVRALRRQGASQNEMITKIMSEYPRDFRNASEALLKIQEAERQIFESES